MILSLTMNPALDISGVVEKLVPNEKSYVTDEIRTAGGNGINAATIASRLGSQARCTGFLGGSTGEEIKSLLDKSLRAKFIKIQGNTRMNLTISEKKSLKQSRLSFPGPTILPQELKALKKYLDSQQPSLFMLGGSLPPGVKPLFIKQLINNFNQRNVPTFVDVPGEILKELISANPTFIKPNLTEFQIMTGKKVTGLKSVIKLAKSYQDKISLQCITSVDDGALLISSYGIWFGKIPKIKICSTVGAGDSMVGAMAHTWLKNKYDLTHFDGEELLRWGLAAACATLANPGLDLGSEKSIQRYYAQIKVRRI